jgi:hypothetical protein
MSLGGRTMIFSAIGAREEEDERFFWQKAKMAYEGKGLKQQR